MNNNNNGFVWKTVNIDEFKLLDKNSNALSYNCSCGDVFWTTLPYLEEVVTSKPEESDYFVILQCESCSLKIKVTFNRKSLNEIKKSLS